MFMFGAIYILIEIIFVAKFNYGSGFNNTIRLCMLVIFESHECLDSLKNVNYINVIPKRLLYKCSYSILKSL